MTKEKDPLRPKEDVKIEDKETGFLNTLKKVVKKNERKFSFDFSQFPNFNFSDQLSCLPDDILQKYNNISNYLDNVLNEDEKIHIIYPPNNEIEVQDKNDMDGKKFSKITNAIYDLAIYNKPLP